MLVSINTGKLYREGTSRWLGPGGYRCCLLWGSCEFVLKDRTPIQPNVQYVSLTIIDLCKCNSTHTWSIISCPSLAVWFVMWWCRWTRDWCWQLTTTLRGHPGGSWEPLTLPSLLPYSWTWLSPSMRNCRIEGYIQNMHYSGFVWRRRQANLVTTDCCIYSAIVPVSHTYS